MKNEYLNLIDKEYEFGCEMHLKIFLAIKKERKKKREYAKEQKLTIPNIGFTYFARHMQVTVTFWQFKQVPYGIQIKFFIFFIIIILIR
jgi:hypothetical protein